MMRNGKCSIVSLLSMITLVAIVVFLIQSTINPQLASAIADLNKATDSKEERAAFNAIFTHSAELEIRATDSAGMPVHIASERISEITLIADQYHVRHRLIDPSNLRILMRE